MTKAISHRRVAEIAAFFNIKFFLCDLCASAVKNKKETDFK